MDPNGYELAVQQLQRLSENIREIFVTGSNTEAVSLFQFDVDQLGFDYEQEDNKTLVTTTNNELFEHRNNNIFDALQEDLMKILLDRRSPLHSLSINILSGITRLNLFRLIRAVDTALRTMDRECRVTNLKIEGATEFQMFGPVQTMLRYKNDTNGTVSLSFPNELAAEAMRQAARESLNIRNLILKVRDIDDILTKLPYFISRNLECLNLKRRPTAPTQIDLRRVVELDQWRNVGNLVVDGFIITTPTQQLQLENKTHVDIHLQYLTYTDMYDLIRVFHTAPHPIEFRIGDRTRHREFYDQVLYFHIPNSDDVIRLVRDSGGYTFQRITKDQIPMHVITLPDVPILNPAPHAFRMNWHYILNYCLHETPFVFERWPYL